METNYSTLIVPLRYCYGPDGEETAVRTFQSQETAVASAVSSPPLAAATTTSIPQTTVVTNCHLHEITMQVSFTLIEKTISSSILQCLRCRKLGGGYDLSQCYAYWRTAAPVYRLPRSWRAEVSCYVANLTHSRTISCSLRFANISETVSVLVLTARKSRFSHKLQSTMMNIKKTAKIRV